jgi:hypothetical protein
MKTKKERLKIEEPIEDILYHIVSNPKFVSLAAGLALSGLGIIMLLSSVDHLYEPLLTMSSVMQST